MIFRVLNYLFYFCMIHFVLCSGNAIAASTFDILIVSDNKNKVHEKIIKSIHKHLEQFPKNKIEIKEVDTTTIEKSKTIDLNHKDLVVAVGTNATLAVVSKKTTTKILSAAIPKVSFEEIRSRYGQSASSINQVKLFALVLDQPLARRLDLIQEILPNTKSIGLVLGPATKNHANYYKTEIKRRNLVAHIKHVENADKIISSFDHVLNSSDVLLGLVDPLVFNRTSARNVLLTAYRWRVPLIGVSPAYVRAGAIAAVYSTPEQLGQQLAEKLAILARTGQSTYPVVDFAKYFKVAVNYQVAESMSIFIDTEENLAEKLTHSLRAPK